MKQVTQISIVLPNVPSSLAKVCDAMRAAQVNIEAMHCNEGIDKSRINMIIDDVETAKMVLSSFGEVIVTPVFEVRLKNQPGSIASVARACAGASLNIRFLYLTSHGKETIGYIQVDDMEKAKMVLK
ncbi:MAG: hypothetical protein KBD00_01050 [Candidatus Peribacteraceae bacterium]|nr:hypothetical protein [Candidatus Peribacteraceae bacterium]